MHDRRDEKHGLPVYESHPPQWLPTAHSSSDLGYPGFYPPRPGQDEDVLSETNVKAGFVLGHHVSAETFSAQVMINENLSSGDTLDMLEELMNAIFTRRAEQLPNIPSSTFRMPTRVTLNDSKRQAWFADLANPNVPLHKLGKSVPHGAKGHDLLDLLHSNDVAIPRAVWFLRVFGANETAGLRNKPLYNPTQYSVDWANLVTSYMKKQLADIALPSAPRPGLNIKQTFKGVLADVESRERWISRFTYCLKLLRTFYSEGLVDNRTFLVWVVQQMSSCNLAQAGFVTRLADEYLDGMIESRSLTRPFVEACLAKLSEIKCTSAHEFLFDTESLLKTLLQRVALALPDAFISPRLWLTHSKLIQDSLSENVVGNVSDTYAQRSSYDFQKILVDICSEIRRRNEAMLFCNIPVRNVRRPGIAASDVQILNFISSESNMNDVNFFPNESQDPSSLSSKIDLLLTWTVTPLQYGDHRPFVAVTLLRKWRERVGARAFRRSIPPPDEYLQDCLFEWLDSSEVARESGNLRAICVLYGKLVKHELFSYANYIQRLIARGELGVPDQSEDSMHRKYVQWIPLVNSPSSLINQRKVALYGVRCRETPEDHNEREIRKEIRNVLPDVFGGDPLAEPLSKETLMAQCTTLTSATRYEQVRTFRQWLLPILTKYYRTTSSGISEPQLINQYCIVVELMAVSKCYQTLLELSLSLLEHSTTLNLLEAVLNTLQRYSLIWTCMDSVESIVRALENAHVVWKTRGIQSRSLMTVLLLLDNGTYLSKAALERLHSDIASFNLALQPFTDRPVLAPDVLTEILLLAGDPDEHAPSFLANGLWIKYRMSYDWAWKVWDNTVASLRQVPLMTEDAAGRQACALRYGVFLCHVDQHLPTGLDDHVLGWFLGRGKNEVLALSADAWEVLLVVLLYLSAHGALKTTTIMQGLVYPAWQIANTLSSGQAPNTYGPFIHAAIELCHQLLLQPELHTTMFLAHDLFARQSIRTRCQDVYHQTQFFSLISNFPFLVSLEINPHVTEDVRAESAALRHQLCHDSTFRQAVYRHLGLVRDAFEAALQLIDDATSEVSKHITQALRMLLCDVGEDVEHSSWAEVVCLLSPWKIAATTIQIQFLIRQMGKALAQDSTRNTANAELDQLILTIFRNSMSSQEADHIVEMARGVDGMIAIKFINNGLKCVAEILNDTAGRPEAGKERIERIGELLRVLMYLAEPFREDTSTTLTLDPAVQNDIALALRANLTSLEEVLQKDDGFDESDTATREVVLLVRVLQFELGFRGPWSPETKEASSAMATVIFRLALFYGSGDNLNLVAFPILIDTLYYLYDEIPADGKLTTPDPFRNYPAISPSELPSDLPPEYRKQIVSLLPFISTNTPVSNLVTSHRDSAGNLVHGPPVVNRPWEWIENLGDPSLPDTKEDGKDRGEDADRKLHQHIVKNSGSLSLESFGARLTGDGIMQHNSNNVDHDMDDDDPRVEDNIRSFQDGLAAETVFKRDWRETRVVLDLDEDGGGGGSGAGGGLNRPRTDPESEFGLLSAYSGSVLKVERRSTPRGSPASSVPSRASTRASVGSFAMSSPGPPTFRLSNSTVTEAMDTGGLLAGGSSKKRATGKRKMVASDDEVEIVEGPTVSGSGAFAKKTRGKPAGKGKGKKK